MRNENFTPKFATSMILASSLPQSYWLYSLIWADPCSSAFFTSYQLTMAWIATTTALEGSASVGLGFIDFGSNYLKSDEDFLYSMRRKRLAFAKGGTLFLCIIGLMLIDQPSANSVLPLILAQGYTAMKMGT